MSVIDGMDYEFAVVGFDRADEDSNGEYAPRNIYGTAFSIGGDYYITAGHVLETAFAENEIVGISITDQGSTDNYVYYIDEHEINDEVDLAVFNTVASASRPRVYGWSTSRLPSGLDVMAHGFAHAFDPLRRTIGARLFRGHIVSQTRHRFRGDDFRIYEVSFACPRGLSGAPLLTRSNPPRIGGVVVGNSSIEMTVFSDREVINDGQQIVNHERFEALHLGIVVTASAIMDLEFRILQSSLRYHLDSHGCL